MKEEGVVPQGCETLALIRASSGGIVLMEVKILRSFKLSHNPEWFPALPGLSPGPWQQISLGLLILQSDLSHILLSLNTSGQRRCEFYGTVLMTF